MKSHTSEFKEEIKTLGKQQSVRITYTLNNEQIILTDEDINSATPNYEASLLKSVMKGLDLDSNVDIPLGTEIKFEYGLLVNGVYEYLNYGNYIVYSSEKQEDTLSYKITCYDKMLYSMKDYEHIDIPYPCTIKQYLIALCNKIGLQFKDSDFANANRQITNELFMTINEDGTYSSMGYTYRDVLDQIAETTGGCICLTLDDKVEVRYVNKAINYETSKKSTNIEFESSVKEIVKIKELDGKSTQATRSGKNKFDLAKVDTSNIVVLNDTGFNLVNAWATPIINNTNLIQMLKPSTTYTCYSKAKVKGRSSYTSTSNHNLVLILYKDGVGRIQLSIIDKTLDIEQISVKTFTTPDDLDGWSMLGYAFHGNNDGSTTYKGIGEIEVKDLMIVEGTYTAETIPDFEMYGASPSPEFPSLIKSVADDMNMIDISMLHKGYITAINASITTAQSMGEMYSDLIKVKPSTTYTFEIVETSNSYEQWFGIGQYSTEEYGTGTRTNAGTTINNYLTFTTLSTTNYISISARNLSGATKIQLKEKSTKTPYSEFGKGTVTIEQRGKNKLDLSKCTFINCKLNNDGTITSNINNNYYSEINTTELNEFIMKNKGMPITFSIKEIIENAKISVVIKGTTTNGTTYQEINKNNDNKCTVTISDDFTEITQLLLRFNRKFTPFTDTTTTVSNLQLEEGDTATDYEPYFSKDYVIPTAPLRSLPNGTKDTIEEDGIHRKIYYISSYNNEELPSNVYEEINGIKYCNDKSMSSTGQFSIGAEVQYELVEEVVEPFTEEQLEVINSMITEKGTNIFEFESNAILNYPVNYDTINEEYINDTNVNFGEKYRTNKLYCTCKSRRK